MGEGHRRVPLIDRLGERTTNHVNGVSLGASWDPAFVRRIMPIVDAVLAYFDAEIEGFEHVPRGPGLIVGNHSGGLYMPDFWAFLRRWVRERGAESPLHPLGFDLIFAIPGMGSIAPRIGLVPASPQNAARLFDAEQTVLVYPGGDAEVYRPWGERHRVDLHGHRGFIRLALRHQVPVVPMVAHGSHDSIIVVMRGETVARRLGLHRVRVNILPMVATWPGGLVPILPAFPIPAKVMVRVCEPLDWSMFPPEAADDEAVVRHCYEEILGRMQSNLDELVERTPHPIPARLCDPLRRGSAARGTRP